MPDPSKKKSPNNAEVAVVSPYKKLADGREIGFAIIGCGVIAPWHAAAIASTPGARLVAVVDERRERALAVAGSYQEMLRKAGASKIARPAIFTNYKTMLRREDVDVVCVCVPSGFHAAVGIDVAKAGKNIITEKPLEITLAKMDALIGAAQDNGVRLAAVFQRRFFENARRIKEAVDAGKFGRLLQCDCSMKWYRTQEYYDSGGWRGTWSMDGGGALMNQCVHGIDLMQWMGGPVAWVQAWCGTVARKNIEVETQAMAIIGFKNGAHGSLQGSTVCYPGEAVINQVYGTKGSASLHDERLHDWKFIKASVADRTMLETANRPAGDAGEPGSSHRPQIQDMVNAVREGREPACTGRDARHSVEIILAIYESARRGGERLQLPLAHDFPATNFPKD